MSWRLGLLRGSETSIKKWRRDNHRRFQQKQIGTVPNNWSDVLLEDVPDVPGMTQPDELRYFYWCCATQHRPGRRVVELGPYVGRSTMALAAGLRRSDPGGKVVSIDRFQWDPWTLANTLSYTMNGLNPSQRARLTPEQLSPKERDSYLPLFEIFTEPLQDSIEVTSADLQSYRWCGAPIDVLMIDAAKSWEILDQIVREFFPCLVDGAVVIHQDYKHFFTHWLHPVTERMIENGVLSIAENVTGMPTRGFRYHKRPDFRVDDYVQHAFSSAEADRLTARSARRFRSDQDRLAAASVSCQSLKVHGHHDRARRAFEQTIREGGFSDNYGLSDLLIVAGEWAQVLTSILVNSHPRVRAKGVHSLAIADVHHGHDEVVTFPAIDVSAGNELAMNFYADDRAPEALRIRVKLSAAGASEPFYDEEFPIPPGSYQAVAIPLGQHTSIDMAWTVSSESPSSVPRELRCIAPMLFNSSQRPY
jgi:hypothetical protein